ncbi:MAG: hypothetical protein MAG453_00335 [Calditrichaeota bacterium]|nr:hypothetical protein [Calditrichota bacterium]
MNDSARESAGSETPIPWREWDGDAFAAARRDDRPILLYLTAGIGHITHLFELYVLADDEVAELARERYVPIRVNVFAQPDVYERYNQGGWPSLCLLSPEGDLLHGRGRATARQMRELLPQVADYWAEHGREIRNRIEERGRQELPRLRAPEPGELTDPAPLEGIRHDAIAHYDTRYHGFGRAPKFPMPELLLFLLEDTEQEYAQLALTALEALRVCPLHDPLAGGFFRYAATETWAQPQFEKLASVNLALLGAYVEAFRTTGEQRYENVARGIVSYLERTLADESGAVRAGQDSESTPGHAGDYYGWSREEVISALDEDDDLAAVALTYFGVSPHSLIAGEASRAYLEERVPPGQIAMRLTKTEEAVVESLAKARERLKRARDDRDSPPVNETRLVADQGRAAGVYAQAALVLNEPGLLQRAFALADTIWEKGRRDGGGLARALGDPPDTTYLADLTEVALGSLELYRVAGRGTDLVHAVHLVSEAFNLLGDEDGVGCFDHLARDREHGAVARPYTPFDANSRLLHATAVIAALTQSRDWHTRALELSAGLAMQRMRNRLRDAAYGRALRRLVHPPLMVDLIGTDSGALRRRLVVEAPAGTLLRAFDPEQATPWTPADKYENAAAATAEAVVYVGGRATELLRDTGEILERLQETR